MKMIEEGLTYRLIISHFVIGILSEKHLCELQFGVKTFFESHIIFFAQLHLFSKESRSYEFLNSIKSLIMMPKITTKNQQDSSRIKALHT